MLLLSSRTKQKMNEHLSDVAITAAVTISVTIKGVVTPWSFNSHPHSGETIAAPWVVRLLILVPHWRDIDAYEIAQVHLTIFNEI